MNAKDLIYKSLQSKTKTKFNDNSDIYSIGIDSLDLIEMVTDAEDALNVRIDDAELEKVKTVGDVVKAFESKLKK